MLTVGYSRAAAASSDAAATTAFLARTSGLDATHINAYKGLINGGVADGWFAKMDVLWVPATQDVTTAGLNLVSASFPLTNHGATFTADQGFAGDGISQYVDTGWNLATDAILFVADHAHIAARSNSVSTASTQVMIAGTGGDTGSSFDSLDNIYLTERGFTNNSASGGTKGFFVGVRAPSEAMSNYKDGSLLGHPTAIPDQQASGTLRFLVDASGSLFSSFQLSLVSAGGELSPTDVANYAARVATYMTAVGAP